MLRYHSNPAHFVWRVQNNESTEQPTEFQFHPVDVTTIDRALGKLKKSLGFGSDGIASNFLIIAFPVIVTPSVIFLTFPYSQLSSQIVGK